VGRGGFAAFRSHEGSTLATWFDAVGYRTALVGKYLNGYNSTGHVPAGWDRWVAFRASTIGYYAYRLTIDGVEHAYGTAPTAYSTDVLADHASAFIRSTPTGTPLFMMFTPYAPHSPFTPAPRHKTLCGSYVPAMPPNVGETDLSDKPSWLRANAEGGGGWANQKRNQMRMLMAVDDAVADIIGALTATGRLSNTVIVFMSDNGLSVGSHRWAAKKSVWDEAIRIPLIVRGPGIQNGAASEELMLNIDVAPTLAELADVPIPATEGRSLVPLLSGGSTPVHDVFAIERLGDATPPPSYCAVRTMAYTYVRYANGEEELYDLAADPWEMSSRHSAPAYASIKADLLAQTKALCSPPPPGYRF
jgi:arylsulfatase A-like enzyme